jgi:hypothetical protein
LAAILGLINFKEAKLETLCDRLPAIIHHCHRRHGYPSLVAQISTYSKAFDHAEFV